MDTASVEYSVRIVRQEDGSVCLRVGTHLVPWDVVQVAYDEYRYVREIQLRDLRRACELAKHKIEQTLEGHYPSGLALQAALQRLNEVLVDKE